MEGNSRQNVHYNSADGSFRFHHVRDECPNPLDFKLHYEKDYEIYMFISGDGSYTIEGSKYELEPYSILMMNANELHVLNISNELPYERMVLIINENFLPPFMLNGVDFFRAIKYRKLGQDNQLKGDTVINSGLLALFKKLQKLLIQKNMENEFVAKCVIVEMLSTINQYAETDMARTYINANHKIGGVLEYINSNLDEQLTLDLLSEEFFITKFHLCRTFKEVTGFSINQYISYKRIHMADRLMLEGNTPTQACYMSGFNCYSSFFKSYRKLTGRSPRSGKKI
jgi:AraC-like DNA-binding protein/mannose-6-phosphate isomerase-like protein (cupin superfamily)